MVSVGFAKLLRIRVRIYSIVKEASPPKMNVIKFQIYNLVLNILFNLNLKK